MSMFALLYGVLFSLHFFSYECEGKIISPHDRTEVTILPGSSMNITWTFDDNPSTVTSRSWYFTSYSGLVRDELIAVINVFGKNVRKNVLPRLDLTEPATLSLSNVSQSYDGTYELRLEVKNKQPAASRVIVYIAKKPNVTFNCSRRNEVNEDDDFTCVCRGEGGRPPANVTWSKDGKQIGGIGKESQTLSLSNVDGKASGTYECKAESYPSDEYIDTKSIVVKVNSEVRPTTLPPTTVSITTTTKGNQTAELQPATHPPTIPITPTTTKDNQTDNCKTSSKDVSTETEWYIVVVILVSGIIIGILFSYIVSCSHRRWFRNRKPERNPEPQTNEVDTTYQELDLTTMNKEDNYQSLRVNTASNDAANDDDSTYTKLNKTRDVENNYQSLT